MNHNWHHPGEVAGLCCDLMHYAELARVSSPKHTPRIHKTARVRWFRAALLLRRIGVWPHQLRAMMRRVDVGES